MDISKVVKINISENDLSNTGLIPCCKCKKSRQKSVSISGMYYIQCPCNKQSPYDFMGLTLLSAMRQWNYGNSQNCKNKNCD